VYQRSAPDDNPVGGDGKLFGEDVYAVHRGCVKRIRQNLEQGDHHGKGDNEKKHIVYKQKNPFPRTFPNFVFFHLVPL
jgi:hypothetical protein